MAPLSQVSPEFIRKTEHADCVHDTGLMGGRVNWLVWIEEEPLDEVEELVLNGVPPLYDDQMVHRLVLIEDSPPYEDLPRYSFVEF